MKDLEENPVVIPNTIGAKLIRIEHWVEDEDPIEQMHHITGFRMVEDINGEIVTSWPIIIGNSSSCHTELHNEHNDYVVMSGVIHSDGTVIDIGSASTDIYQCVDDFRTYTHAKLLNLISYKRSMRKKKSA